MKKNKTVNLEIIIDKKDLNFFLELFLEGVDYLVRADESVFDILSGHLHLENDFIQNRIQTIFLDHKVVDDLKKSKFNPGSVLALSAAMPGLVGATLRTSGPLKKFREEISYKTTNAKQSKKEFLITIKLFNLLVKEIGPLFLEKGIWINSEVIENNKSFFNKCQMIKKNNIKKMYLKDKKVFLKVFILHQ